MITALLILALQLDCPSPLPGFASPSVSDSVLALQADLTGAQSSLFVGGQFLTAGSLDPTIGGRVARWDGTDWSPLSTGLPGTVRAFARFDHGTGLKTFAAGEFFTGSLTNPRFVAEWNGSQWLAVPLGPDGAIFALATFDDGSGPALYAGGNFTTTGGLPIARLARWKSGAWSAIGEMFNAPVQALAVHDDGTGPALYAAGDFTLIGGTSAAHVARWNGAVWAALGSGTDGSVLALASFQGALFAGGSFASAGGARAAHVARWSGGGWQALGAGTDAAAYALAVHDDGNGARLYVGGDFLTAGGIASRGVAAWDGTGWSACSNGVAGVVRCFASWNSGAGTELFAGGNLHLFEGQLGLNIARWNGHAWRAIAEGPSDRGDAIAVFDDGGGPHVYVGGRFIDAGGRTVQGIARWNGTTWDSIGGVVVSHPTPGHPAGRVRCMQVFDGGSGPQLILGGEFELAGGAPAPEIASWNGHALAPVGVGPGGYVVALAAIGSGPGAKLYAAAQDWFNFGSGSISAVAEWDGTSWSALGSLHSGVHALAVYDDGTGPSLYAAGAFPLLAGQGWYLARWDGSQWVPVGPPTIYSPSTSIDELGVHDVGNGLALLVAGSFTSIGGQNISMLASWNGSTWSSLGYYEATGRIPRKLAMFDDGIGRGERLFVASPAANNAALHVLDGSTWSLAAALAGDVSDLSALFATTPPASPQRELWLAGTLTGVGSVQGSGVGALRACDGVGKLYCFGDGSASACPCANASAVGDRAGCLNSFGSGGTLRASGNASLMNDTLELQGGAMTDSFALYFQAANISNGGLGVVSGDGITCTAGPFVRFGTKTNTNGASSYPVGADARISVRGLITGPGTRRYAVRYRNSAAFCSAATFNYTNAVEIVWQL